jgi:hypothetical protein
VHWWDAVLSTKTGSPGDISQINDLIGSLNLAQATGTSQPDDNTRTLNSLVALDFDGGDSIGISSAPSFSTSFHAFVVAKIDALADVDIIIDSGPHITADTNDGMSLALNGTAGSLRLRCSNGTNVDILTTGTGLVGITLTHLIEAYSVGTTVMGVQVDGGTATEATPGFGCSGPDSFTLMARSPASTLNAMDGALAMAVICNQRITGADLTSMRNYCQTRWGTP